LCLGGIKGPVKESSESESPSSSFFAPLPLPFFLLPPADPGPDATCSSSPVAGSTPPFSSLNLLSSFHPFGGPGFFFALAAASSLSLPFLFFSPSIVSTILTHSSSACPARFESFLTGRPPMAPVASRRAFAARETLFRPGSMGLMSCWIRMCLARASERVNDLSHSGGVEIEDVSVNGEQGEKERERKGLTRFGAGERLLACMTSEVRDKSEPRGLSLTLSDACRPLARVDRL
jgi:hypothetical protein